MIAGYLLAIGGIAQLIAGLRADLTPITTLGAVWIAAGAINVVSSTMSRRSKQTRMSTEDLANPAERAKVYQGVTGQLPRGLLTLVCAAASVGIGIQGVVATTGTFSQLPDASTAGSYVVAIVSGGIVGVLALLGLLLYWSSGTERAARYPATVVILTFKELPLSNGANRPYLRFVLDVYPEGMTGYESTIQTVVPILAVPKLAVGARFSARVAGPDKPNAVIVDFTKPIGPLGSAAAVPAPVPAAGAVAMAPPPAAPFTDGHSTTGRLRELDALRAQGLVTEAEYAEQRARILASI